MMRMLSGTMAAFLLVAIVSVGWGQAPEPTSPQSTPAAPANPTPPGSEAEQPLQPSPSAAEGAPDFGRVFEQWKELLGKLRKLRSDYQTADADRREEIRQEYDKLIEQGTVLEPLLMESAEAAYEENPQKYPELPEFLMQVVQDHMRRDNYEEAYRLAKKMLDAGSDQEQLHAMAGVAAYATEHLDDAEKYLKLARQKGAISEIGLNYLGELPTHRAKWEKEKKIRAAEAEADDLPRVLLKTNRGDIVIELFENEAPIAVANFISLVEKGYYDGLTFHRVLGGFMAQGGCPRGDGTGGPGYNIPCECYEPDARYHFRGTLSMAHAGRDTGGSQFFLTFVPTSHLDGKHTAFGRVVEGMEVLSLLRRRDPGNPMAPESDKIIEAKVIRKRDHPYVPEKVEG